MFRVLVLGGVALVGGSACGSSPEAETFAGAQAVPSFPHVPAHPQVSIARDAGVDTGLASGTNAGATTDAAPDAGPDAGQVLDAATDAGPDAGEATDAATDGMAGDADAARCPGYEMLIGGDCFPIEGPQ